MKRVASQQLKVTNQHLEEERPKAPLHPRCPNKLLLQSPYLNGPGGDILGYARVSTADQDLSGQKNRLIQNGAVRVFEDVISGKSFNRPGLAALLDDRPRPPKRYACRRPARSFGTVAQSTA